MGPDASAHGQPFFAIDEYDTTGEEEIRSLDNPLPNGFLIDGKPLPITGDYLQTLDMRTSQLDTRWTSGKLTVECLTVIHPTKRIIAQRWSLTGDDAPVDFDLGIGGRMGQEKMTATNVKVGPSKIKGKLMATEIDGPTRTVDVVLTLGPSPNRVAMFRARGIALKLPPNWDIPPSLEQFSQVEDETKKIWTERWKTDIQIDGPAEDQQTVRSFMYYLQSSIHPDGGMSISPFGLSNQMYNGHVFWDADIWVFPALALIDPAGAKAIADYRIARVNSKFRPFGPDNRINNHLKAPARYPWESSVSGKETISGPSEKEIHISGDVAWMLAQASSLGLADEAVSWDAGRRIQDFFQETAIPKPITDGWELHGVMSPDENHTGDNDLYTNLLAQWLLNGCTWTPASQRPMIPYHLPHDATSFLTYDNDTVKSYKQAAAVLSIYPLQYPPAEKEAKVMMDRFADKVIKNGPAMSDSVHALIWARLGEIDKAYDTWRQSWQPFTNQRLMLFSEKRNKPTTYFTTGAAGSLQTVLFGFLGFRLDSVEEQGAAWSTKLEGNSWLSIKPNLPPKWKSVKFTNFAVLGHHYTLTATHRPNGPDAAQVIKGD